MNLYRIKRGKSHRCPICQLSSKVTIGRVYFEQRCMFCHYTLGGISCMCLPGKNVLIAKKLLFSIEGYYTIGSAKPVVSTFVILHVQTYASEDYRFQIILSYDFCCPV